MIDLSNISLQFNGKYLFKDINYKINSGDRISLVGANGTGKSSFLKIILGQILPESGKVIKQKGITIGYLPQENIIYEGKKLIDEAKSALTNILILQQKEKELTDNLLKENLSEEVRDDLIHQLGEVHHKLEELDSYSADSRIKKILLGLGFENSDFEKNTESFSGGWQMRIALSKILISQNDLIMMDEPTNHLDIDSLEWLINFLKNYSGALLVVSHDKRFINAITNKTLEIYLGKIYSFNGDYDSYLKFKEERDRLAINKHLQQKKKIKETERFIERFRSKATKAKQVQSRIQQLEKVELIDIPEFKEELNIKFPTPPPSGKINIELKSISKSYGQKVIFDSIDFSMSRGEKIAFVGPNGAGKTTLAKIIAGIISFNSGKRIVGHNTIISHYAQDIADNLNPNLDIIETLENISKNLTIGQLRSLLGAFLFSGDDVFKKIGVLSGGEKSRVALAKILLTKSNLIILDEPTNHLDIESKQVLQNALRDFEGSLVIVSHDVDFLSPIVNKVVEIKKGELKIFYGGIEYYLEKHEQLLLDQEIIEEDKLNKSENFSRRDQKRAEAELRQKKYTATKDILRRIKQLEDEIEKLEEIHKKLEEDLLNPEIYNNPKIVKDKNIELNNIKEKLDAKISEWSIASEEYTEIEKQFDK
jgi:ATP-binding cassette subfamily F protein 3